MWRGGSQLLEEGLVEQGLKVPGRPQRPKGCAGHGRRGLGLRRLLLAVLAAACARSGQLAKSGVGR